MATTRYRIAATPSNDEKIVSSLKAARVEADNRAKLDRVDVEVTTVATGKLAYTAQGAITAPAAAEPETAPAPAAEPETPATEDEDEDGGAFDSDAFEAELAQLLGGADTDTDEDGSSDDQDDAPAAADPAADDEEPGDASDDKEPADDNDGHRGQADCGCSVEDIIRTGTHGDCAEAAAREEKARAVERDRPARPRAKRTGGGSRPTQGPSVVPGWDLLYDKPRQDAQVGKSPEGKYALICTKHKHAHPLQRLTQERGLRGGSRTVWCPDCK